MKTTFVLCALCSLLHAMMLSAEDEPGSPQDTVAAFHAALSSADRDAALAVLDPEVLIFESGGAELSRDEYAAHHLGGDMEFSAATARTIVDQRSGRSDEVAWVLTRSKTSGTFRDKAIDVRGVETMLLRRTEHGWRIVHVHWSSRSR
ncbi:MAG: nuclear transport factor 2 family protein [Acidobacteria bacterium]|nr:nuclear transport factor 2 family protein [Acidobacteriota bacterium]